MIFVFIVVHKYNWRNTRYVFKCIYYVYEFSIKISWSITKYGKKYLCEMCTLNDEIKPGYSSCDFNPNNLWKLLYFWLLNQRIKPHENTKDSYINNSILLVFNIEYSIYSWKVFVSDIFINLVVPNGKQIKRTIVEWNSRMPLDVIIEFNSRFKLK